MPDTRDAWLDARSSAAQCNLQIVKGSYEVHSKGSLVQQWFATVEQPCLHCLDVRQSPTGCPKGDPGSACHTALDSLSQLHFDRAQPSLHP